MSTLDAVTLAEAGRILGVARSTVQEWVLAARPSTHGTSGAHRRLLQAEVESLALELYDWRRHADDPDAYWLTSHQAGELLGISRPRLGQLGD